MSNCDCNSKINFGLNPTVIPKPATCPEPTGPHPVSMDCGCPKRPEPVKVVPTPFCTVTLPEAAGTDEAGQPYAPKLGAYHNAMVHYLANGANVFYDSEGVPTRLSDYAEVYDTLEPQIDTVQSNLEAEVADRQQADTWLQENINAEVNARESDRDNLQININKEVEAREEADNNLQEQIDAIINSSDVKDVVGTYAELEAYDKSTLGDNDIIKVLNDETHDGAIAYYRFNKTTDEFTYIGETGPYYTKSEVNAELETKQNVLVSDGDNQNIKTINGESILGTGNLEIQGSGAGGGLELIADFTINNDYTPQITLAKSGTSIILFGNINTVVVSNLQTFALQLRKVYNQELLDSLAGYNLDTRVGNTAKVTAVITNSNEGLPIGYALLFLRFIQSRIESEGITQSITINFRPQDGITYTNYTHLAGSFSGIVAVIDE